MIRHRANPGIFQIERRLGIQSEMAARLGEVLYRTTCTVGRVYPCLYRPLPDWTIATSIAAADAPLIWSIVRAARYVLSHD